MAEAEHRQQTTETLSKLYDGRLRLERRNGSPKISARTFFQGKSVVFSTGEQTLGAATKVATDWYLDLRDRVRKGEHLHGRSFADVADAFIVHANQVREVSEGQPGTTRKNGTCSRSTSPASRSPTSTRNSCWRCARRDRRRARATASPSSRPR